MAKSKAKKLREKLVREGRRNPEDCRSPFAFADMRTRRTKTKKDSLYKKNQSPLLGNDGSFFIFPINLRIHKTNCFGLIIILQMECILFRQNPNLQPKLIAWNTITA